MSSKPSKPALQPNRRKPAANNSSGTKKTPAASSKTTRQGQNASKASSVRKPPPAGKPATNKPPAGDNTAAPARFDRTLRLLTHFERFAWDIAGVACLALGLMTLVGLFLPQLSNGLLRWWIQEVRLWFGWGSLWLVALASILGLWMLRRRHPGDVPQIPWGRVLAMEAAAFTSVALLAALGGINLHRAEAGLDGGRVGWGLAELLHMLLSPFGLSGAFWIDALLASLLLFFVALSLRGLDALRAGQRKTSSALPLSGTLSQGNSPVVSESPLVREESASTAVNDPKKKAVNLPPQFRKNFRLLPEESPASITPPPRDERLPGLDLLSNEQASRPDERHINLTAGLIEKTLDEFGIPAKVVDFRIGPTVTQFAVVPGFVEKEKPGSEGDIARQKIRVAQIASLQRDLTLALSAERLRIEAPVPGRPYIGIEVPNSRSTVVRLRPILESDLFYKVNSPLAIGLGRDVSGQPVVTDLARMPHLLVAGTTGSGKSVCVAAITTCLVMNNTPEDLRLVMVDPKMVELVRFNGLPHLLGKVETELERILSVLRWTVAEMDRRYKVLEASHSRNIETYNRKARKKKGEAPMPRIILMIDELADLMMSAPDVTEHNLVRLAQLARATGIHLVVATQRPSTDVVTGLIKANFPARISFSVASSIDSRVILDSVGAESLLGRGDMLFLPPEAASPLRSQGAMVTDQEVERVINFWQKAIPGSDQAEQSPWDEMIEQEATLADRDGLVEQAIQIVRGSQRASASMLQRRLRIGYPRAARLIDELEELGVVGPGQGGGRDRKVLIGREDVDPRQDAGWNDEDEDRR